MAKYGPEEPVPAFTDLKKHVVTLWKHAQYREGRKTPSQGVLYPSAVPRSRQAPIHTTDRSLSRVLENGSRMVLRLELFVAGLQCVEVLLDFRDGRVHGAMYEDNFSVI